MPSSDDGNAGISDQLKITRRKKEHIHIGWLKKTNAKSRWGWSGVLQLVVTTYIVYTRWPNQRPE